MPLGTAQTTQVKAKRVVSRAAEEYLHLPSSECEWRGLTVSSPSGGRVRVFLGRGEHFILVHSPLSLECLCRRAERRLLLLFLRLLVGSVQPAFEHLLFLHSVPEVICTGVYCLNERHLFIAQAFLVC